MHHIAEGSCLNSLPFAFHSNSLDRKKLSADLRPSETVNLADMILFFSLAVIVFSYAGILFEVIRVEFDFRMVALERIVFNDFPANLCDFTLKSPNARFSSVIANDVTNRLLAYSELFVFYAIILFLLWHKIAFGNIELLFLGIARDANHFHSV